MEGIRNAEDALCLIIQALCLRHVSANIYLQIDPAVQIVGVGLCAKYGLKNRIIQIDRTILGDNRIHSCSDQLFHHATFDLVYRLLLRTNELTVRLTDQLVLLRRVLADHDGEHVDLIER